MTSAPEPVGQAALDDLRARLRATRRVPVTRGTGWDRGTDPAYLDDLLPYWAESYDWRAREERLRALPWVRAGDGFALHRPAGRAGAPTVVLLHGWPDSFLRFERVLPLLDDVNVVVPCLPGYPYGPSVTEPGTATRAAMADHAARLLDDLGYERYVASGGDVGSGVAEALALGRPDRVSALHLTDVPLSHMAAVPDAELGDAERAYRDGAQRWGRREGAYLQLQATKPHTAAVGLGDSPAGLAAWIVEKLRSWSDCDGDVESVFPRDDLLTWVTLYWLTGTIGSSFASYYERPTTLAGRIEVPTVVTVFPRDLVRAPREFAERIFDLRGWSEEERGGHFGAWEEPERFVAGLRSAVELPAG